ncbi:2-keto-4-pentenoate hydratase [Sphingomonas pokkalii]|uniref:Fumarylacetoacetase-like C-terminal domain-containing protein n=1 Tax=Sphingomonas pokkalii TaxID=2175090 RepID=A0A2U0SHJ8_9SPHN|nr:fumarylacetoacetate hydrolase family protein [Sphingomonas pokkalii]PVX30826.1 hypothetical protein DD559_17050 [Sphingomonas pokkalii]
MDRFALSDATSPRIYDDARLTAALVAAHRGGVAVEPPTEALSLARGYAVQARVFAERHAPLAGYKLAATSPGGRTALGVDAPLVGLVNATEVIHGGAVPSTPRPLYAEAELVLRIGIDLPPARDSGAPALLGSLADAIDAVFAGIELCSSRFADDDVAAGALVADNCLLHALVLGDRLSDRWEARLAACPVRLWQGTASSAEGSTALAYGHPLKALAWLAAWLGEQGRGFRAGDLVATGSATGITPVTQSAPIAARFGDFGGVQAHIGFQDKDEGEAK